jgi:vacuolar-type H+-ATPase subunit E/Vma4
VAITDILTRIETDAAAEAANVVEAANAEAARILGVAETTLAAERTAALAAAEHDGAEEAATLLANARLVARDRLLGEKRELAERVLDRAREALEAMPDAEYLEFIASGVKRAAVGGETLMVAAIDAKRLGGLADRLSALGVRVTVDAEPAPIARGVLLTGDRVRVEVSPAALVADHRDRLLLVAASTLFGGKE